MRSLVRRGPYTTVFVCGTLLVLVLAYSLIIRVHQGWEDEVYWVSTCLSMFRRQPPIPSVLADFPDAQNPLRFYGPTLFWLGALALHLFGATMRTWRTYTFAGGVVFLAMIAFLFYRVRRSWLTAAIATFAFSLSIDTSFGFSLPGRPDGWTQAMIVLALAVAAGNVTRGEDSVARFTAKWVAFGLLLGLAASTTPRSWPLLCLAIVALPLLLVRRKAMAFGVVAISALLAFTLIILPLHMTPWSFIDYVHRASNGDNVDVSPLMGGSWGFGHSGTQIAYYGGILVLLGVVYLPRWHTIERYIRWLLVVALLNFLITLALLSRTLNMTTYWGFLLEIGALLALTEPLRGWRARVPRMIAVALFACMVMLRVARELPVLTHWQQRDPKLTEQAMQATIPRGSLVYGPLGGYFYPALAIGSEYRYPVDWTTPGRASTPGQTGLPAPMRDACHTPAYLVWPLDDANSAPPALPHATMQLIADHPEPPERTGGMERMVERVPGGRSEPDVEAFRIYRLQLDPHYCARELAEGKRASTSFR